MISTRGFHYWGITVGFSLFALAASANEVRTNAVTSLHTPHWVTRKKIEAVVDRIQSFLEWDIRRVRVRWYPDAAKFKETHRYDDTVLAYAKKSDMSIHIGPRVVPSNFEMVFGHELAHIVLFQKYEDAIPSWLDEGLANFAARPPQWKRKGKLGSLGEVDYHWLSRQPRQDVTHLTHPFLNKNLVGGSRFHYMASTAVMEMIAKKCNLKDLLQLSMGKKLETYLKNTCEIQDLSHSFQKWIQDNVARDRKLSGYQQDSDT